MKTKLLKALLYFTCATVTIVLAYAVAILIFKVLL
jgi:hypothetical protein